MSRTKPIKRDDWGQLMICRSYGERRSIPGEYGFGPTIIGQYSKNSSRGLIEESRIVYGPAFRIRELYKDSLIQKIGENKWRIVER